MCKPYWDACAPHWRAQRRRPSSSVPCILSGCPPETLCAETQSITKQRFHFTWSCSPLYRSIRHGREYFTVRFFSYIRAGNWTSDLCMICRSNYRLSYWDKGGVPWCRCQGGGKPCFVSLRGRGRLGRGWQSQGPSLRDSQHGPHARSSHLAQDKDCQSCIGTQDRVGISGLSLRLRILFAGNARQCDREIYARAVFDWLIWCLHSIKEKKIDHQVFLEWGRVKMNEWVTHLVSLEWVSDSPSVSRVR